MASAGTDRHHVLPLGGNVRQDRRRTAQRNMRVHVQVVTGQTGRRRDQSDQSLPTGVREGGR
jgi:hypothetical protein